jgi:hypothetical protein
MSNSLALARAVFKATPALSTSFDVLSSSAPSAVIPRDPRTLFLARNVFLQSLQPSLNQEIPIEVFVPSISAVFKSLSSGAEVTYNIISEKVRSALLSVGEVGKKILDLIMDHPVLTASIAAGVVLAIFSGVAYKFYVVDTSSSSPSVVELPLMTCPITLSPFVDPVIASDGHTYERCAIEAWFRAGHTFVIFFNVSYFKSHFFLPSDQALSQAKNW